MIKDNIILKWYSKGFDDELDRMWVEKNSESALLNYAYMLGRDHAIIGDDVSSIDNLTSEQILETIKSNCVSRHVIEVELNEQDMETQDGGQFGCFNVSQDDSEENGMYVKFCSWDDTCKHERFSQFIGRKVRIIIETID